jgi:hypothetical protein
MGRKKKKERKSFDCFLNIHMYKVDRERLRDEASRSTCETLSEYARRLLLRKTVTMKYRDRSLDSFIDEAIALRMEMALVRKDLPWTKESEARMIALQESIKSIILKIYEKCKSN